MRPIRYLATPKVLKTMLTPSPLSPFPFNASASPPKRFVPTVSRPSEASVKLVAGALPLKLYAVPLVPPLNVPVALSVPVTASPVPVSSVIFVSTPPVSTYD